MQASQFAHSAGASMVSQLILDSWRREDFKLETETRLDIQLTRSFHLPGKNICLHVCLRLPKVMSPMCH